MIRVQSGSEALRAHVEALAGTIGERNVVARRGTRRPEEIVLVGAHYDSVRFVAFVSNLRSRRLLRRAVQAFRAGSDFPVEHLATPGLVPGAAWSDHRSFWRQGYRALMVTDTAFYRYPHYHSPDDTPDKLDYGALARITAQGAQARRARRSAGDARDARAAGAIERTAPERDPGPEDRLRRGHGLPCGERAPDRGPGPRRGRPLHRGAVPPGRRRSGGAEVPPHGPPGGAHGPGGRGQAALRREAEDAFAS